MNLPNGGKIDVTFGRIIIAVALLVTINVLSIFTEQSPYIPVMVNMFGIIVAFVFAKDSVDKNRDTKAHVDEQAQIITALTNRNRDLAAQMQTAATTTQEHAAQAISAATVASVQADKAAQIVSDVEKSTSDGAAHDEQTA